MGFNTTIMLCNDALHVIEKNPAEFVEKLSEAIQMGGRDITFGVGNWCNGVQVIASEHADIVQVISVGRNHGKLMGFHMGSHHTEEDKVKILKSLASDLGYRLVKRKV